MTSQSIGRSFRLPALLAHRALYGLHRLHGLSPTGSQRWMDPKVETVKDITGIQ